METSPESFTFTVGKLDAGMAILLGERAHLIEFPSVLLPSGATTGSIVNIAVHQNVAEEQRRDSEFWALQNDILEEFGRVAPDLPKLQLRNVTQTSVTLEWPSVQLATAKLRSLDIYRNGQRLAAIPSPLTNTSTKLSGLEINTEYSFQLFLRTTAGTFPSNVIRVRTHTMTDTSGICVCFGNVQDPQLLAEAKNVLSKMEAKWSDKIQIDTTHFVCTTPAATPGGAQATGSASSAPGVEYQRALQLSIPVVQPQWILACFSEKKMVPISGYYLGAAIVSPPNSPPYTRPQSMSQSTLSHSPASPEEGRQSKSTPNRASMPAPSRTTATSPPTPANSQPRESKGRSDSLPSFEPTPEESGSDDENEHDVEDLQLKRTTSDDSGTQRSRSGTMNHAFKFPRTNGSPELPGKNGKPSVNVPAVDDARRITPTVITPSSVEVPPPPPVEKERSGSHSVDDGEDDVGETVEIEL